MNRKSMQVVIVIVCLAAAGLILAYSMGWLGGGSPTTRGRSTGSGGPTIAPVGSNDSQ